LLMLVIFWCLDSRASWSSSILSSARMCSSNSRSLNWLSPMPAPPPPPLPSSRAEMSLSFLRRRLFASPSCSPAPACRTANRNGADRPRPHFPPQSAKT
jgi:hypothetical protein